MSTDVTQSSRFKAICAFDPESINVAKSETYQSDLEKVSGVVTSVISHVQSTDRELDEESLTTFAQKIGFINTQFNEDGKGTPFTVALYTLDLLTNLKKNLSPENQDLLKHPFVTQLKALAEQDVIEDQLGVARQLALFQRDVLNPALAQAQTPEELAALRPLIELTIAIKPKVDAVDNKGVLNQLSADSRSAYNYKHVSLNPLYSFLVSYTPGKISNLGNPEKRNSVVRKLTELHQNIARIADGPHMSTEDKVAIYHAYLQIQTEFVVHGDALNEVIDALETTLGLHKGIKSGFPLELKKLTTEPITGELGPIAAKLTAFQTDHLIPALQHVTTREELLALEPLVDQCIELKPHVAEADAQRRLNPTHDTMIELYNAKFRKTHQYYPVLVAYEQGQIGDLSSSERRTKIATNIGNFIEEAIKSFDHPLFSPEEKRALYEAVLTIQQELEEHGDGNLFEPTAKALRTALKIPEIKKPKPKSDIFSMWEKRASGSGSQDATPKSTPVVRRREVSPEVRQQQCLQIMQEKIAGLDLGSQFLGDEIQDIKRQIRTLRSLSKDPTQFAHLEKALDALLLPAPFTISNEENAFIHLLGKKHKLSDLQLEDYQAQERPTVMSAQSTLLKELKRAAERPERLNAVADRALKTISATAKEDRFRRFTDLHKPNPALTHNFQAHYPALVQTFELFTRETVTNSLEETWTQLERAFDSNSDGRFSPLLTHYSYLDPRRQFHFYIEQCQEAFFSSLDLRAIDRIPLGELQPYLTERVEEHKTDGAEVFQRSYSHHFQEEHLWLLDNFDKVTMPYNQGDSDNTNQGEGVCYNNSLYRMSTLMKDPTMDRGTLQMGSNERTRFYQTLVDRKIEKAQQGVMSVQEANQALRDNCEFYGLRHHHTQPISPDGGLHKNLAAGMHQFSELGYSQVILVMRDPKARTGHAVNLIFDQARGIYSIEDDNLGRIDFTSLKELQAQGKAYFQVFYPEYTSLEFECYRQV